MESFINFNYRILNQYIKFKNQMTIFALVVYAIIAYVLWANVFKIYYAWWFYRRQGIPSSGFPLPFLGNLISFARSLKGRDEFSLPMITAYIMTCFNGTVPRMVVNFRGALPYLTISDPDVISELYMAKSRYLDKYQRSKKWYQRLTGESLLFERSTERQAEKRKRLSTAFYKEKMQGILNTIIKMTAERMDELKEEVKKGNNIIDLV